VAVQQKSDTDGFWLRRSFGKLVLTKEVSDERKQSQSPAAVVREIRRQTRRKFTAEEKTRIILEGLKGETSISEMCRQEGIVGNSHYRWSKNFLEARKKLWQSATAREANNHEVGGFVRRASN
jgi:transposase